MTASSAERFRDPSTTDPASETQPDEILLQSIRAGDSRAFETLYLRHYTNLASYAHSITKVTEIARDVVGEVFLALWRSRTDWQPRGSVRAYLFTAVRNRALNERRGEHRAALWRERAQHDGAIIIGSVGSPADNDDLQEQHEKRRAVRRAISALPEKRRAVLTLRWQHQMEIGEIAQVLDISENAVRMHLSKGIRTIRNLMQGHTFE